MSAFLLFFSGISERSAKNKLIILWLGQILTDFRKGTKHHPFFFWGNFQEVPKQVLLAKMTRVRGAQRMGIMMSIDGDFMTDLPKVQRLQAMKE